MIFKPTMRTTVNRLTLSGYAEGVITMYIGKFNAHPKPAPSWSGVGRKMMRITFRKTVSETGKIELVWKDFKVVIDDDDDRFYVRGNRKDRSGNHRNGYWSMKKLFPDEIENAPPKS
jgi:hypothetical protein